MLSDYQRAVLSELGIVAWQSQHAADPAGLVKQTSATLSNDNVKLGTSDKISEQSNALAKLTQLKQSKQAVSYAGQIICSFELNEPLPSLARDILQALGVEKLPIQHLDNEQLRSAKDYALLWSVADYTVEFSENTLLTPPISNLLDAKLKKQLWSQIQLAANV